MTDPSKRPLNFPTSHIPYLQKHRIYELFHEIARELVIRKPDDHVLFTKQVLVNAAHSRDIARVVILPSPKVNILEMSKEISRVTKQVVVTQEMVKQSLKSDDFDGLPSDILAKYLAYLVRTENCYSSGWIMVDCLRSEADAKSLIQQGIIPTHTLHFIAPFHPDVSELLYCEVSARWPETRRVIAGLRNVFKGSLREVHLGRRHVAEVVIECVELMRTRAAVKPITPRVVILGPRGSGKKTQAKIIAQALDVVHVDFEYLICQAWTSSSKIGEQLRACKKDACLHSDLLSQVVNKRILEEDCLRRGWVLTGYPFTDTDFKYLDSLDTPPNRVIFLECDLNVCKERLRHRKVNVHTGSQTDVKQFPEAEVEKILLTHPKDDLEMIDAELEWYCRNYGPLRKYCGGTASVVNGDQNERWVNECVCAVILKGPLGAPPRRGLADVEERSSDDSADDCACLSEVPSKILDSFILKV
ncbi:unnamed protein product [Phaedon cochleariae]|uniref:Adenylate kinase 8 n=1 Tax=Phaedon cochleariae TaxID=80249 RepID=A0A9P0DKY4_PHACE|nr:unnamed protein product [Phaedon cochleariae]